MGRTRWRKDSSEKQDEPKLGESSAVAKDAVMDDEQVDKVNKQKLKRKPDKQAS